MNKTMYNNNMISNNSTNSKGTKSGVTIKHNNLMNKSYE